MGRRYSKHNCVRDVAGLDQVEFGRCDHNSHWRWHDNGRDEWIWERKRVGIQMAKKACMRLCVYCEHWNVRLCCRHLAVYTRASPIICIVNFLVARWVLNFMHTALIKTVYYRKLSKMSDESKNCGFDQVNSGQRARLCKKWKHTHTQRTHTQRINFNCIFGRTQIFPFVLFLFFCFCFFVGDGRMNDGWMCIYEWCRGDRERIYESELKTSGRLVEWVKRERERDY